MTAATCASPIIVSRTASAAAAITPARAGTGAVEDPSLEPVAWSEWRLVGPGLASLIVALRLRFRMSYRRIRECLHDWLGSSLSVVPSRAPCTRPLLRARCRSRN
ncbi:MAG: hypothetical protein N838_33490 [Thiohalocapsa sp. PB-PSB1]|nr:MAG: hypothetical protein N838_33490 [Thiohalocapsa sp. PB-PSB1]